jgi:hypothetical protein
MAAYNLAVAERSKNCGLKGKFFVWLAPHKPGDALPSGRIARTFTNGTCRINAAAVRAASSTGTVPQTP